MTWPQILSLGYFQCINLPAVWGPVTGTYWWFSSLKAAVVAFLHLFWYPEELSWFTYCYFTCLLFSWPSRCCFFLITTAYILQHHTVKRRVNVAQRQNACKHHCPKHVLSHGGANFQQNLGPDYIIFSPLLLLSNGWCHVSNRSPSHIPPSKIAPRWLISSLALEGVCLKPSGPWTSPNTLSRSPFSSLSLIRTTYAQDCQMN